MKELMLVSIDGVSYGIWRESVLAVDTVKTSHRLSIARASIATLSIIGDHTETLADLAVCLGHSPTPVEGEAHVLRPVGAGVSGFLVGGEITGIQADPGDCVPLPGFLSTSIIDRCAVHGSMPVPLVDISALSARVLASGHGLAPLAFASSAVKGDDATDTSRFRVFSVGRSTCAAACREEDARGEALSRNSLTRLPLLPPWVQGIALSHGRILPVVDLARRLAVGGEREDRAEVVLAAIGAESLALLVDEDRGTWTRNQSVVRDLPPVVQTPWMHSAAVNAGRVAAIIDLGVLLSGQGDSVRDGSRCAVHAPDSDFPSQFNKVDVDVLEFSLFGATHALPRSETDGTVPLESLSEIAFSPGIVAGVAEHNGDLLPVVDLARVFGRSRQAEAGAPLIVVKNGSFRALVMVESVLGERRVELPEQRAIPVVLPYPAVYGCYVDEKTVRLILNVEAITLHFDESEAGRLSSVMSSAMLKAGASEPRSLWQELSRPRGQEPTAGPITEPTAEPITEPTAEPITDDRPRGAELPISLVLTTQPFPTAAPEQPAAEFSLDEGIPEAEGTEGPGLESPGLTAAAELPEGSPPVEQATTRTSTPEPGAPELSWPGKQVPEPETSVGEPVVGAWAEPSPDSGFSSGVEHPEPGADGQMTLDLEAAPVTRTPVPSRRTQGRRTALIVLGGVLVVGAGAAVLLGGSRGKAPPPQATSSQAAPVPAQVAPPEAPQPQAPQPQAQPQPQPAAQTGQGQQLEIVVPAERATDVQEYVVVRGDTLWSICERLTGNPFAYVRIAGENRIADPDLIFPGQRIRIVRK